MVTATTPAPQGSAALPAARAASGRTAARALPLVLGLGAAASAAALAAAAARAGSTPFPVHPVGLGALLLAGIALLPRGGRAPAALVTAAGAGLLAYALLGAAAAASAAGAVLPGAASVVAALWGAAWLPPLVATSAAAACVRGAAGERTGGALVVVLVIAGAATTTATAVLQRPVEPFDGLPPAAPAAWAVSGGHLLDALSPVLAGALLAAPALLGLTGARRRGAERVRALLLCLSASTPVLVVVVCVLLALARDPGGVDPSVGSTGFLVVLAAGVWAGCTGVRSTSGARPGTALLAARCAAGAVVVVVVLAAGVLLAALLDHAPLLLLVGAVALLAAGGLEGWRRASGWAAALLEEDAAPSAPTSSPPPAALAVTAPEDDPDTDGVPAPAPPVPPRGWEELTPREREVLAVLASGASNAGIAAQLGISPRTVEAHLRSVFTRLCLDPADGANRRVVAARLWMVHGGEPSPVEQQVRE